MSSTSGFTSLTHAADNAAPPAHAVPARPWQADAFDTGAHAGPIRSMITADEVRYLHWLTRTCYTGAGAIVDAGPLLGGSTAALAEGLRQNPRVADKAGRIHSYDLFTFAPYMTALFDDERMPAPGDDLLPRFVANTEPWRESLHVHPGDLLGQTWSGGPIEILFIDLAKSWTLQRHLLREFFPHLIPGVSIVVQQDYFFHGCPWIHLVMEHLAGAFRPVHVTDGSTLGFSYVEPVAADDLCVDYERRFSRDEAMTLMTRAAERFTGARRLVALTAQVPVLLEHDDVDTATEVLESIRRSPFFDQTVAIDFAAASRLTLTHDRARHPRARCRASAEEALEPNRRDWPTDAGGSHRGRGSLAQADVAFMRELIVESAPRTMIEVGVASDDLGALLLEALADAADRDHAASPQLHSFVADDLGYLDERPARRSVPGTTVLRRRRRATRVVRQPGVALDARDELPEGCAALAVIDGHRYHPWPAADLLALLPVLAPGAWVILRDVRLPLLSADPLWGRGTWHLLDAWQGETRRGGALGNTAALRLPPDAATARRFLLGALHAPWQTPLPSDLRDTLMLPAGPMASGGAQALRRIQHAAAQGRPVLVWGAGHAGRRLLEVLRDGAIPVSGFIDRDARKWQTQVDGLTVSSPRFVLSSAPRPYVAVSGMFSDEIACGLTEAGWVRDLDFAVV